MPALLPERGNDVGGTAYRGCAGACALLALIPAYYAATLPWAASVDFDVTGFFWLLENIPRLTAVILTTILLGAAQGFWVESLRKGH